MNSFNQFLINSKNVPFLRVLEQKSQTSITNLNIFLVNDETFLPVFQSHKPQKGNVTF